MKKDHGRIYHLKEEDETVERGKRDQRVERCAAAPSYPSPPPSRGVGFFLERGRVKI